MATLTFRTKLLSVLFVVTTFSGCANGPFAGIAAWNPYYRGQWEKDELAGPTFHTKLNELRAIRRNPTSLSPEEQRQLIPTLTHIAQESSNRVLRAEAMLTLAELETPEAIPALQLAMNDADADVRIAACQAWGRLGGQEALTHLSQAVQDDIDLDVRLVATEELAKFQDRQSVEALAIALNDKDPALQHRAVQSLKSVSGQDYGNSIPAWRDFVEGRSPALPEPPTVAERLRTMSWF